MCCKEGDDKECGDLPEWEVCSDKNDEECCNNTTDKIIFGVLSAFLYFCIHSQANKIYDDAVDGDGNKVC